MAADLDTKASPKFEVYVEAQLATVRRRLRALDVGGAALVMLAVVLGYAVFMAVFDLAVGGRDEGWIFGARLVFFGIFLIVLGYCGYLAATRLLGSINPYYAARQLEETIPDAKNSVINWLDLKEERLPGAIRASLGQRAARDLKEANPDQVIDTRPNLLLGSIAGALFFALIVIFALSPHQFGSLLARAFAPFRDIALSHSATITLVRPADGNVTVPHDQRVEFIAQIDGRFPRVNQPGAPALLFRYNLSDEYVSRPLEQDADGRWTTVMPPDLVQTGFWYKIAAGDAATPEYQVQVRSAPHAVRYEVGYRYRPYLLVPEETVLFPNEQAVFPEVIAHRGTEVTVLVRANQPVRDGRLQLTFDNTVKDVPGEPLADDPRAFRCTWTLEKSGHFTVFFRSASGENNTDRSPHKVHAIEDGAPVVILTQPGKDVSLPVNGTLTLEGRARDDFGVKSLALKMRVLEGALKPELADKPYRSGKSFRFDTGGYPAALDYHEVVPLDKLAAAQGGELPLTPGMVLEYWLEAIDNSDYPSAAGNVGKSKAYKLTIDKPRQDEKKNQQERKQAEQKQQEHEKKQDQQQQQQNDEQNQQQQGGGQSPDEKRAEDLKNQLEKTKQDLEKKIDDKQQQENQGGAKGNDPPKAENKPNEGKNPPEANAKDEKDDKGNDKGQNNQKPETKQQAGDNQTGKNKDQGKDGAQNDPKSQPSQAKGGGDDKKEGSQEKQPQSAQASEPKDEGNDQKPPSEAKGAERDDPGKNADNQNNKENQNAKGSPKEQPKDQPSQAKDQGKPGSMGQPSTAKDNSPNDSKNPDQKQGGQPKSAQGDNDAPSPQAKNDKNAKQDEMKNAGKKADSKPGSNQQLTKDKGSGKPPPDAQAKKQAPPDGSEGVERPAQVKGADEPTRKAQAKSDPRNDGVTDTKQGPPAQAKGQPENKNAQPPEGSAKQTPPEQSKESAVAKNDGKPQGKQQGNAKEPTLKDLERLKEQLDKSDARAMKEAKELAKNFDNIKDPQVRKAAEELMKQAAKQAQDNQPPMAAKDGPPNDKGATEKDGPMTKDPMAKNGDTGEPKPMSAKDGPEKSQPKEGGPEKPSTGKGEGSGPNAAGLQDPPKGSDANRQFAERGGNLQLEDLMERMTPEMRRAAGISDQEWANFLKMARDYESQRQKLDQRAKKDVTEKRGAGSRLPSVLPRRVHNLDGQLDPVTGGNGLPPPELREAQRRFTQSKAPESQR